MNNLFDDALPILEDRWGKGDYVMSGPLLSDGVTLCAVGGLCEAAQPGFSREYLKIGWDENDYDVRSQVNEMESSIYRDVLIRAIHELYPEIKAWGEKEITQIFQFNDHPEVEKEDVLAVFRRASEMWNELLVGDQLVMLH